MKNTLLTKHLEVARNELILAYNTAKNDGDKKDTMTSIALSLADVSADLQYLQSTSNEQ